MLPVVTATGSYTLQYRVCHTNQAGRSLALSVFSPHELATAMLKKQEPFLLLIPGIYPESGTQRPETSGVVNF